VRVSGGEKKGLLYWLWGMDALGEEKDPGGGPV